ncbi:TetR/AcrR family transcriptional regulator [Jeotgalibacillus soli]|uniref:HTH tetR-type domain-containing protein n=1 Tax=Jeotgalibacillus soli TaxID=889306 RepID=A0A0C2RPI4_9BACL|nr:TetR/AcrR family transcriptional regulator [Jeotgalibacillus soli]KIL52185.1 hypothetical protein KP78_05550 [Jeotgalibacillus soli]
MTKQKLKDAALTLFAAQGYEGTSIAQIVKEVEIRKSSFYAHFESKAALFLAVYKDAVAKELERISGFAAANSSEKPMDQLREIFMVLTDPASGGKETHFLHRILFYPPVELKMEMQSLFTSMEDRSSEYLQQLLKQCVQGNDRKIDEYVAAFYAFVDGLSIEAHLYDEPEHLVRRQAVWHVYQRSLN